MSLVSPARRACGPAVLAPAVLVDVVAQVDDQVEVVLRHLLVGGEQALLVVLAGGEGEPQLLRARRSGAGSGAGAADRAGRVAGPEPVPVPAVRPQPVDLDVDRVAQLRRGDGGAALRPTFCIPSSSATSHRTSTGSGFMPPSGSSGLGASRVQRTTPVAVGSPDATPSVNGSAGNAARRSARPATRSASERQGRQGRPVGEEQPAADAALGADGGAEVGEVEHRGCLRRVWGRHGWTQPGYGPTGPPVCEVRVKVPWRRRGGGRVASPDCQDPVELPRQCPDTGQLTTARPVPARPVRVLQPVLHAGYTRPDRAHTAGRPTRRPRKPPPGGTGPVSTSEGKSCRTIARGDASSRPGSSYSPCWRRGRTSRPRSRPAPRTRRRPCPPPWPGSRTPAPSTCTRPRSGSSPSSSPGRRTGPSRTRAPSPWPARRSARRSPSPRTRTAGGRRSPGPTPGSR